MRNLIVVKSIVQATPKAQGELAIHDGSKYLDPTTMDITSYKGKGGIKLIGAMGSKNLSVVPMIDINPNEFYIEQADPQAAAGTVTYNVKTIRPIVDLSNKNIAVTVTKYGALHQPQTILNVEVPLPDALDDAKLKTAIKTAVDKEIARRGVTGVTCTAGNFIFDENGSYQINAYADNMSIVWEMSTNTSVTDINTGKWLKALEREFMTTRGEHHDMQDVTGKQYMDAGVYNVDEAKRYFSLVITSRRPQQVPLNNFGGLETMAMLMFEKKADRDALYKAFTEVHA